MKFLILLFFVFISGCTETILHEKSLPSEEFEKVITPAKPREKKISSLKNLKNLSPNFYKKVSLEISDEVPLKEAFLGLCKQAHIGCEITAELQDEKISFSAYERSFLEVFEDLASLCGKKITIQGNKIRLEEDFPHLINYNIQFLSGLRKTENKVSTATQVLSGSQNEKNQLDNGSNSTISSQNTIDFWKELNGALNTILAGKIKEDDGEKPIEQPKYSFHKQAGILSVVAYSFQHKALSEYLMELKRSATAQVLIEAKIVEVALNKQNQSGINWNLLFSNASTVSTEGEMGKNTLGLPGVFTMNYKGGNMDTLLSLMEKFGTTKTLSSPRLTVMNNQNAVLKIGENRVFFRLKYNQYRFNTGSVNNSDLTNNDLISANSEIQTVPIGLILAVQPSIDLLSEEITLNLRPTITNSHDTVSDPAVAVMLANSKTDIKADSKIPIIEVREIDSVLNLKSGQVAIMGGLMQEKIADHSFGPPGTTGSFLENIFGNSSSERRLTELVIFLKATIIENPSPEEKDFDLYNMSVKDNRPWSAE